MPDLESFRATLADLTVLAKRLGLPFAMQARLEAVLPTLDQIELRSAGMLPSCAL